MTGAGKTGVHVLQENNNRMLENEYTVVAVPPVVGSSLHTCSQVIQPRHKAIVITRKASGLLQKSADKEQTGCRNVTTMQIEDISNTRCRHEILVNDATKTYNIRNGKQIRYINIGLSLNIN